MARTRSSQVERKPAPSSRAAAPLAWYRLGRAALDLGTFTISDLEHLAQLPANTIYSFVSELGSARVRSEALASTAPGRPRKRYSLTEEGIDYLLEQNLAVAKLLRAEGAEAPKPEANVFRIGRDVWIKGEVTCDRNLLVEGRVDGEIAIGEHDAFIAREAKVQDVSGRVVMVEGEVTGTIRARQRVVLGLTSAVRGDIISPVVEEAGTPLQDRFIA